MCTYQEEGQHFMAHLGSKKCYYILLSFLAPKDFIQLQSLNVNNCPLRNVRKYFF